jgi:hypothetical protein
MDPSSNGKADARLASDRGSNPCGSTNFVMRHIVPIYGTFRALKDPYMGTDYAIAAEEVSSRHESRSFLRGAALRMVRG